MKVKATGLKFLGIEVVSSTDMAPGGIDLRQLSENEKEQLGKQQDTKKS